MFHFDYRTENTCAQLISLDLEGNVVHNVRFMGGCNGNLQAIPKLIEGWTVEEVESKLTGILCGRRPTSCADQLAKAVRGGNTKKLAEAIAGAVGADAQTTSVPLGEDVDLLFLGSSVYAGGVDDGVKRFISGIDVKVGKVVNFSTAALVRSTHKQVAKLLAEKDIPLAQEEFYCKGSFALLHRGRPNGADCKAAAEFAKKLAAQEEKRDV